MTTNEKDALNNIGLPQFAIKNELEKKDIKLIKEQIKELVNNFCVNYRCYSLIID